MFSQIFFGTILLIITVSIHCCILGWSLYRFPVALDRISGSFGSIVWLLCRLAVLVIFGHVLEIGVWGAYYHWSSVMPGWELAAYFSAVTYATIGYGDVVPPPEWRMLASIEGLTGILMCSWSGGYFFAIVVEINTKFNRVGQT